MTQREEQEMIVTEGMRDGEGESHLLSMLPVAGLSNLFLTTSVHKNPWESWLNMEVAVPFSFPQRTRAKPWKPGFIFLLFQANFLKN